METEVLSMSPKTPIEIVMKQINPVHPAWSSSDTFRALYY
jgi:hypothetical protein